MEIYRFETARFAIVCIAEPEEMDPADSFCTDDDVAFAREDDPAHWFCAVVQIVDLAGGAVLGRDSLGGCSYNSFDEFVSSHWRSSPDGRNTLAMKAKNTCVGHYFPDMVRTALAEARETIERIAL